MSSCLSFTSLPTAKFIDPRPPIAPGISGSKDGMYQDCPAAVVLLQGWLAPQNMWQRLETVLIVTIWGGCSWPLVGGGQDAVTHPTVHRTAPTPQDKATHVVNRAQLGTPALRRARGRPADLPPSGFLWLFPSTFSPQISPSTVYPGAPTCVRTHVCPTLWQ